MRKQSAFIFKGGILIWSLLYFSMVFATDRKEEEKVWKALKSGGHIVLIRHAATEPGIGDPPEFKLGDCSTQRNLSAQGKNDARKIGEAFRRREIPISDVLTSRWCRCIDTAKLAFGRFKSAPMLDSMFDDSDHSKQRKIGEFSALLARLPANGNLVMVTHQVNIEAFSGVSPSSGEMVIAIPEKSGRLKVIGRLMAPGA